MRAEVLEFLGSPRFSAALATAIVSTGFLAFLLQKLIGWPGLLAIVTGLVVLALVSLLSRREELEWRGILPISVIAFLGWSVVSIFWSDYQWSTLGGIAYQVAFAVLATFVALARDVIQIVRTFGDVLRVVLGLSLVLEVFSGLLVDSPIRFLSISGNLDRGGPIQGVEGTRNQLGLVAIIALVTFGTELFTRSLNRVLAIVSIAVAGLCILFSQSPVSFGVLGVLGIASVILLGLRRLKPETRRVWQTMLGVASIITIFLVYVFRARVIELLNAGSEFSYRVDLWHTLLALIQQHLLEGFGWVGSWRPEIQPFIAINEASPQAHQSALNAFLDVWMQLGLVGLLSFAALVALAFSRSWILASQQRSRSYVWPALVLVALLTTSLAESSMIIEAGWMTLIICAVKASQRLSWRRQLPEIQEPLDAPTP